MPTPTQCPNHHSTPNSPKNHIYQQLKPDTNPQPQTCITLIIMNKTLITLLALLTLSPATLNAQDTNNLRQITVLYTNDEHGWMEGMSPGQGAANLVQLWRDQEGYTEDGPFLVLSGGDNFTGPAISTWTQGQSMVEVMNAMHYTASAIGNHEFDFALDALGERIREADYPYLGANIRWKTNDLVPTDLGILPYTLVRRNGLAIGIIGLTTTSTAYTTNPTYVKDLAFTDYEPVVRDTLAQLRTENPDIVFIIAHACMDEMEPLAANLSDLDIALIGGGHCNELVAEQLGDTVVLGGGYHFTSYATATFTYDIERRRIVARTYATHRNRGADPDPGIQQIVDRWAESSNDILSEVIGWNARPIVRDGTLEQLIIDSWLVEYPTADIAITNRGGVRTDLEPGEITFSTVFNILPFDNTIVSVEVPGRVVVQALADGGRPVVAGLQRRGRQWLLTKTGQPLQMDETYTMLLNSFMYDGGDNFGVIREADPGGFDTGANYRQPFVDWLKRQETSERKPLQP